MNERIKKLSEQCWDKRLDGLHFDQEKFAESIVAEICALLAENREFRAAVIVGTHFGVEE